MRGYIHERENVLLNQSLKVVDNIERDFYQIFVLLLIDGSAGCWQTCYALIRSLSAFLEMER